MPNDGKPLNWRERAAVTVVITGGLTLTARHKGTAGNDVDVRHSYYQGEGLPAGVALAIADGVAGTGNPDIATVFAAIGDAKYQTIALGFADAATLTAVEAELASRWGPMRQLEAMAFAASRGTHAQALTLGNSRNSQYVSILPGKGWPHSTWAIAASYAGTVGYHGAIDPARPFQTLPLPGILPPAEKDRFTRVERDLLLKDGMSTFTVDAGGQVLVERAITTYQVNPQALEDIAWLDVNTPLTLAYIRLAVRSRVALRYPRHKLADDDARYGAGQAIVTPRVLKAEVIAVMRDLEDAGLVEGVDRWKDQIIVERDANDPSRVNALLPPDLVNQFRVFAARIEFRL